MKKILSLVLLSLAMIGCSKVPAGNVGVKVYLLGTNKGVDHEVLGVGRYWIGFNEELYLFPTFQQQVVWGKHENEREADESITFQNADGLVINGDIGMMYHLEASKVPAIFQKYRKGIDEITDEVLRTMVRDALVKVGSTRSIEQIYGSGKDSIINEVQGIVSAQVAPMGILVDKISLAGRFRLPPNVDAAINAKIEATQRAQQSENELQKAKAEAEKSIAEAYGQAESMVKIATAEAQSNALKQKSLTEELIRYEAIQKWNGVLPTMTGGAIPFINIGK
jgi:regulator of protease activity HflC (stomatin/prohibitin superfamily)